MRERIGHEIILELPGEVFTVASLAIEGNNLFRGQFFQAGDHRKDMREQQHQHLTVWIGFFLFGEEQLEADSSGLFRSGHLVADFPIKRMRSRIGKVFFMNTAFIGFTCMLLPAFLFPLPVDNSQQGCFALQKESSDRRNKKLHLHESAAGAFCHSHSGPEFF